MVWVLIIIVLLSCYGVMLRKGFSKMREYRELNFGKYEDESFATLPPLFQDMAATVTWRAALELKTHSELPPRAFKSVQGKVEQFDYVPRYESFVESRREAVAAAGPYDLVCFTEQGYSDEGPDAVMMHIEDAAGVAFKIQCTYKIKDGIAIFDADYSTIVRRVPAIVSPISKV